MEPVQLGEVAIAIECCRQCFPTGNRAPVRVTPLHVKFSPDRLVFAREPVNAYKKLTSSPATAARFINTCHGMHQIFHYFNDGRVGTSQNPTAVSKSELRDLYDIIIAAQFLSIKVNPRLPRIFVKEECRQVTTTSSISRRTPAI